MRPHEPARLATVADYERACRRITPPGVFRFLYGEHGAPDWSTYTSNRSGFHALKLRPRVLTGVSDPRVETTIAGQPLGFPVVVGPVGALPVLAGYDADAEDIARAARDAGTISVVSAFAAASIDAVAAAAPGRWWQQVFVDRDRRLTESRVRRSIDAGARGIALTVSNTGDTTFRHRDGLPAPPGAARRVGSEVADAGLDAGVDWSDVDWLRSLSDVPLVVKGIQTAEDAALCLDHGVDGIVVSNHGGRFAQGVRGTMEALPEIVEAVGDRIEVSIDGGVRQGQDVLKALALGARTVWIGRAAVWGQAVGGTGGVAKILEILRSELRSTMALCGVADVTGVDPALVTRDAIPTLED